MRLYQFAFFYRLHAPLCESIIDSILCLHAFFYGFTHPSDSVVGDLNPFSIAMYIAILAEPPSALLD